MSKPVCLAGSFVDGKINAEGSASQVAETVMGGQVVILKGVFASETERLVALRHAVFNWSQETEPLNEPEPSTNCHCRQAGVSRLQQTPHVYHSYNFNRISQMPPPLSEQLHSYFKPLCDFQNSITGNSARLEGSEGDLALHPQIIQYPLGGGVFGRHFHPLNPQKIGMIVGLSQRGTDYDRGGTCFDANGSVVDIEPFHDIGDIALFRFDLPHWVTPSDLRFKFDWNSERGRWTMVLPYY